MDKHELTKRLARRLRQSKGHAADRVDALVYRLWKDGRLPNAAVLYEKDSPEASSAPVKES